MPPPPPPTTTGADDDDYVSPYATTDERLRRSVMAALPDGGGGGFGRRSAFSTRRRTGAVFRPSFEGDAFLSALGMVRVLVEGVLVSVSAGGGGEERGDGDGDGDGDGFGFGESEGRGRGGGGDRATNSLYDPLENLECMLDAFRGEVEAWANKPKYFKEVTVPFIVRTIETSTSEASTLKKLRQALMFAGPIDDVYVHSFDPFVRALEEPILELRAVGEFIEGVLKGESGSVSAGLNSSTTMFGGMSGESVGGGAGVGVGGSGGEVREKESKATGKISSKYFDTILNPETDTQASSSSGDVRMEESAAGENCGMGSSAFADLSRAAGLLVPDLHDMKSPSPRHVTEPIDTADAGSPSYSPPASPSLSFETLLKHTGPPATTPSFILSKPTPTYHAPTAHQRTLLPPRSGPPRWKLDLHARKGHPIHLLHAGPRQLAILTRCLELVHKATRKGEECVRRIGELKGLSKEMQGEREQWEEFCGDLEGNVMMMENEDGGDRDVVAREYGRLDDGDGIAAWGYRRFDNPTQRQRQQHQHLPNIDEDDDQDAETDVEDWRKGKRSDRSPVHHHRSAPVSGPQPRSSSSRMQGSASPSPSPSTSSPSSSGHDDDDANDTRTSTGTRKQKKLTHPRPRPKERKHLYDPHRELHLSDADPDSDAEIGHADKMEGVEQDDDGDEWESTDEDEDGDEDEDEDGDGDEKKDKDKDGKKDKDKDGKKGLLRSSGAGGVVGLYGEVV